MHVYLYTDDSWQDEASGHVFECYNAVGWEQNGSALDEHGLLSQVIWEFTAKSCLDEVPLTDFNPYEYFTLEDLKKMTKDNNIVIMETI